MTKTLLPALLILLAVVALSFFAGPSEVDLCLNLNGTQTVLPPGFAAADGVCLPR